MHEDDAVTQADLGLVHLLNGELDRASQALLNSRTLDPAGPRSLFLLGLVRLEQRRPDDARALFAQVPSSDPFYTAARRQMQGLRQEK